MTYICHLIVMTLNSKCVLIGMEKPNVKSYDIANCSGKDTIIQQKKKYKKNNKKNPIEINISQCVMKQH